MKLLLAAILLASMTLAGCSGVRIYEIKKDRVDQRVEGNRGYIKGTPPPAPIKGGVPKRTLIGIDMEVPILPGEEGYKPTSGDTVIYAEDIKMEPKRGIEPEAVYEEEVVIVGEKVMPKRKMPVVVEEETVVEEEEIWVK